MTKYIFAGDEPVDQQQPQQPGRRQRRRLCHDRKQQLVANREQRVYAGTGKLIKEELCIFQKGPTGI